MGSIQVSVFCTIWIHIWTATHYSTYIDCNTCPKHTFPREGCTHWLQHTITHILTATHYNHTWYGIDRSQCAFRRMCTYIHCNTLQHIYWLQHTTTHILTAPHYNTYIDCNTCPKHTFPRDGRTYWLQHTTTTHGMGLIEVSVLSTVCVHIFTATHYRTYIDCNTLQHIYWLHHTITHILTATLRNTGMGFRCKAVCSHWYGHIHWNDVGTYIDCNTL